MEDVTIGQIILGAVAILAGIGIIILDRRGRRK
jgi:hypothetical protein